MWNNTENSAAALAICETIEKHYNAVLALAKEASKTSWKKTTQNPHEALAKCRDILQEAQAARRGIAEAQSKIEALEDAGDDSPCLQKGPWAVLAYFIDDPKDCGITGLFAEQFATMRRAIWRCERRIDIAAGRYKAFRVCPRGFANEVSTYLVDTTNEAEMAACERLRERSAEREVGDNYLADWIDMPAEWIGDRLLLEDNGEARLEYAQRIID